jgi:hypothetical protein
MYLAYEMESACPGCNRRHTLIWKGRKSPDSRNPVIYKCPSTERHFKLRGVCVWGEAPVLPDDAAIVVKMR